MGFHPPDRNVEGEARSRHRVQSPAGLHKISYRTLRIAGCRHPLTPSAASPNIGTAMRALRIDIIWKYVMREVLSPSILGLCVYVLVFLMNALFQLAELAIKKDLALRTVL